MFYKKGFTLLEMLVVIGIIGILIGVGSVSYSSAQKKARDSRRQADIKSIQNSLEQYYSTCGFSYPSAVGGAVPTGVICPTGSVALMPTVPIDPKTNAAYSYSYVGASNTYSLCANTMETLSPTGFCVNNQQ